jgi:hypothetical protein
MAAELMLLLFPVPRFSRFRRLGLLVTHTKGVHLEYLFLCTSPHIAWLAQRGDQGDVSHEISSSPAFALRIVSRQRTKLLAAHLPSSKVGPPIFITSTGRNTGGLLLGTSPPVKKSKLASRHESVCPGWSANGVCFQPPQARYSSAYNLPLITGPVPNSAALQSSVQRPQFYLLGER